MACEDCLQPGCHKPRNSWMLGQRLEQTLAGSRAEFPQTLSLDLQPPECEQVSVCPSHSVCCSLLQQPQRTNPGYKWIFLALTTITGRWVVNPLMRCTEFLCVSELASMLPSLCHHLSAHRWPKLSSMGALRGALASGKQPASTALF